MVSTVFKRGWLRRIYRLTTPGGGSTYATLSAALNAENDSANVGSASGGAITATSANGHSIQFAAPGSSSLSWSNQDLGCMTAAMLDLYDQSRQDLIDAGTASPSDAQIYTQMLAELQPAFSSTPDFANLMANRQ